MKSAKGTYEGSGESLVLKIDSGFAGQDSVAAEPCAKTVARVRGFAVKIVPDAGSVEVRDRTSASVDVDARGLQDRSRTPS